MRSMKGELLKEGRQQQPWKTHMPQQEGPYQEGPYQEGQRLAASEGVALGGPVDWQGGLLCHSWLSLPAWLQRHALLHNQHLHHP